MRSAFPALNWKLYKVELALSSPRFLNLRRRSSKDLAEKIREEKSKPARGKCDGYIGNLQPSSSDFTSLTPSKDVERKRNLV
ncbi:hypothetical protein HPP92_001884 [Vanilla planifolia]|uniref:Uncharacterized protein n=1 Tax=Vanilla planifolia TaxID=51239 RepID=A0A835S4B2_VANPL|nr:hypothetical protein HPP92_001884 [Vanilla planifolia]